MPGPLLRQFIFVLLLILQSFAAAPAGAEDRIALVIGMADYQHVPGLKNTVNDAKLLSDTLKGIGFSVQTLIDKPRADVLSALAEFSFHAETADLALIYFAGHGVEVQGKNFLIPVDANVKSNKDIVSQSISLDDFLAAVDHARKMRIVILDSCRNNPFPDLIDLKSAETAGMTVDAGRGLGGLAAPSPDRGTLVAFAARDGQVAMDGDGNDGPFALALHQKLIEPGLEISLLFRQVRDDVLAETNNLQEPNTYGSLPGVPFYLAGSAAERQSLAVEDKSAAWSKIVPDQQVQLAALAKKGDTRSMLGLAYIRLNPGSADYDPAAGAALLQKSAAANDPEAEFELARLYEKGIGVPQDLAHALALYQAAAAQDFPDAVNELGFFYYSGALGLPIDQAKALTLFRKAADLKQPEAMFNVASFIDRKLMPDTTPQDAAGYLYQSLRSGSQNALDALSTKPKAFSPDTWRALQVKLAEVGFYSGKPTGIAGPTTVKAMRLAFGLVK